MFGSRPRIQLKTSDQMRQMRRAGLVVSAGLDAMGAAALPGVTTAELDNIGREVLGANGATSSFLNYGVQWGYPPYPAVSCISVNETVVHGIPNGRVLAPGDIVSIDFGAIVDGWHGDAARTFTVGVVDQACLDMVAATRQAMWAGIAAAVAGHRIGDVSAAVQASIVDAGHRVAAGKALVGGGHGYGIIREYTGHGIGTAMHQPPDVPNYGKAHTGARIVPGMCLAIEPMLTAGGEKTVELDDQWTVVTADSSRATHWENTVAITAAGLWVLTEPDGGQAELARLGAPFAPLGE